MKSISLVSLHFAPAHLVQLTALYRLFTEMGYNATIWLSPEYKKMGAEGAKYTNSIDRMVKGYDAVVIENIAVRVVFLAIIAKIRRIPCYYVLHEPWPGKPRMNSLQFFVVDIVNLLICMFAYKVILPSQNAVEKYESHMKWCNHKYAYFPLIYCDNYNETHGNNSREFFSFIGYLHENHNFDAFLDFVDYSMKNDLKINFLLATSSSVKPYLSSPVFQEAVANNILKVRAGEVMSEEEISSYYQRSICVWNVYKDNTQSGVLPYALMLGTPVIANDVGLAKSIIHDKWEGCIIHSPVDNWELYEAYTYISEHFAEMTQNARGTFLSKYYYKGKVDLAKKVFSYS